MPVGMAPGSHGDTKVPLKSQSKNNHETQRQKAVPFIYFILTTLFLLCPGYMGQCWQMFVLLQAVRCSVMGLTERCQDGRPALWLLRRHSCLGFLTALTRTRCQVKIPGSPLAVLPPCHCPDTLVRAADPKSYFYK